MREGGDRAYLADSILEPASGVLGPDEALSLCDVLRPFFQRLPACRHGMKTWTQRRIECLVRADRGLEALRLRRQLAGEYPRNVQVQCDYLSALVERGQTEAAAAWLGRVLVPEAGWEPEDEESLRSIFTAVLRSQRREAELLDYLAAWIGRNPLVPRPYQEYLSLLVQTGHVEQAETLIARWLAEGRRQAGALSPDVAARLQAAVWVARGEGGDPNTPIHWPVDRWSRPLIETVLALARCPLEDYASSVPVSGAQDRRRHREPLERQFVEPSARRRVLPPDGDGRPQASGPVGEALAAGGLAVGAMDSVRGFAARRGAVEEDRRCAAAPLGCRARRRRQARAGVGLGNRARPRRCRRLDRLLARGASGRAGRLAIGILGGAVGGAARRTVVGGQ